MKTRVAAPRIPPLPEAEWTPQQREEITRGNPPRILNIFRTLIRYPDLYRRWMPFANHVLFKSSLTPRDRELVILRVGWLCRSAYEFHQHKRVGKAAGLSDADIERVKVGPGDAGWSASERALLQAVDELHADSFITDPTWRAVSEHYNEHQLVDLVFGVGQYTMVSMALNTFGVQIEEEAAKP
jgi:4-carboxymuconolactone decarboxylase